MKTLCLYASYVDKIGLPYYSRIYLSELKRHFTEVVYLHSNSLNNDAVQFLENQLIKNQFTDNNGFDFGQWKRALSGIHLEEYDQLCLVNDSCILYAPLDNVLNWFNSSGFDFGGLTHSEYDKLHIQSYFLLFNKNTLNDLVMYLNKTEATNDIHQIINDFEIGLSQYLISLSYTLGVFLTNDGYRGEFSPYYQCVRSHIEQGSPVIKKKIIFSSYRKEELFTLARMNFNINPITYINLIKNNNHQLSLSFEKLMDSDTNKLTCLNRLKYNAIRVLIQLYKTRK